MARIIDFAFGSNDWYAAVKENSTTETVLQLDLHSVFWGQFLPSLCKWKQFSTLMCAVDVIYFQDQVRNFSSLTLAIVQDNRSVAYVFNRGNAKIKWKVYDTSNAEFSIEVRNNAKTLG